MDFFVLPAGATVYLLKVSLILHFSDKLPQ